MPARKRFHLTADGDDWVLKEKGAKRATRRFSTKAEALKASPGLVRKKEPSLLAIHGKDGKIQDQRTYG